MTPEEKYRDLYEQMYDLCKEQGWGDPFSYARSREIYMAGLLGHRVADDYAGEDATDEDGASALFMASQNDHHDVVQLWGLRDCHAVVSCQASPELDESH